MRSPRSAASEAHRPTPTGTSLEVVGLYVSTGHNYFGHYGGAPGKHPLQRVDRIKCLAGRGVEGDRFLDYRGDYRGQITFFSLEVYEELCLRLGVWDKHPGVFRRNVITRGEDLNRYVGCEFALQGVRFEGVTECSPCDWMDVAFAPGSMALLKGRGGLRARILSDGRLETSNP